MAPLLVTVGAVAALLSGSVPWGVVLGVRLRGIDIRRKGSGNTGATNSMRYLGWRIALIVAVLDVLKGLLPVVIARLLGAPDWGVAVIAVAATIGHCWSPLMGFRGGKGMATGGGAAIGILPILAVLLPVMIVIVAICRYVSLASIIASATAITTALVLAIRGDLPWVQAIAITVICSIIIGKHHGNIGRLLAGTERRFGADEARGGAS